jgi:hypothetical protein
MILEELHNNGKLGEASVVQDHKTSGSKDYEFVIFKH